MNDMACLPVICSNCVYVADEKLSYYPPASGQSKKIGLQNNVSLL